MIDVKKKLQNDNIVFKDGYDFLGADFDLQSISQETDWHNTIMLRIINNKDKIDEILNSLHNRREIYQFYLTEKYYDNCNHRHVQIKIGNTEDIMKMM